MTKSIENTFVVTKEDFDQVTEAITYATVTTSNYNRDCFGMSDIRLAMRMESLLDQFITRVINSGYCPHALMNAAMQKHKMWIKEESKYPKLKQQLDDLLSIDMSDLSGSLNYCIGLFKSHHE